jgi:hypothetical protein
MVHFDQVSTIHSSNKIKELTSIPWLMANFATLIATGP